MTPVTAATRCHNPRPGGLGALPQDAASMAASIGSMMAASSFSGLLTRGEIGHIRIRGPETNALNRADRLPRRASEHNQPAPE